MKDQYGREIHYLRLSVTERCNLRCVYCSPSTQSHCEQLTAAEIERVVSIMVKLGINKVRVTGGEPLLREDLEEIIARIARIDGIRDIPMTTNGVGLSLRLDALAAAGLTRLNISLDTTDAARYERITQRDALSEVLSAIDAALKMELDVKLNAVLMRGVNDGDLDALIALTRDRPLALRFIELMPIGRFGEDNRDRVITKNEILARYSKLSFVERASGGVAEMYALAGYAGSIGFISPVSHSFCHDCNRIRLTSDGKIKPCLGNRGEVDLLPVLRDDLSGEDELRTLIERAIFEKPRRHAFDSAFSSDRSMNQIGG